MGGWRFGQSLAPLASLVFFGMRCTAAIAAPSLAASALTIDPGASSAVVVSGEISGESTFGVNILLELRSRPGNRGIVSFTSSPPVDIAQLGDPWPGAGTFTTFDTDSTGTALRNGCVDDNGSFVPAATTYAGPLASFPLVVSANAAGIWDVSLSTSKGDSGWEGLATSLSSATVTVGTLPLVPAVGTTGLWCSAILLVAAGAVMLRRRA